MNSKMMFSIFYKEPRIILYPHSYSVLLAGPGKVVDLQGPGALAPLDHPGLAGGQAPGQRALLLPPRVHHQVRGAREHGAERAVIACKRGIKKVG